LPGPPDQCKTHQPYSHFFWGHGQLKPPHRGPNIIRVATALCTDIPEVQCAGRRCAVKVFFQTHPADWDVAEYILQHPIMQQEALLRQQQAVQAPGSAAGSTQLLGPFDANFLRRTTGHVDLVEWQPSSPLQFVGDSPHAVVLNERVRGRNVSPLDALHTVYDIMSASQDVV
jgi:hypothetical protein